MVTLSTASKLRSGQRGILLWLPSRCVYPSWNSKHMLSSQGTGKPAALHRAHQLASLDAGPTGAALQPALQECCGNRKPICN